jgi:hypothetical protein
VEVVEEIEREGEKENGRDEVGDARVFILGL